MFPRTILACVVMLLQVLVAAAGPVPDDPSKRSPAPSVSGGATAGLTGPLRELLLRNLPTPLYESSRDWGRTAHVTTGLKWTRKAFGVDPQGAKGEKNDGTWRKVRITAENLPASLVCELRDIQHPEPGRTTFAVSLAFDAKVEYEQQKWKAGLRLYSGSARARVRIQMALNCELVTRLEWIGKLLPNAAFRLRVVQSNVTYDHLVVEHIAGVGGDMAKLLGEAIQRGIRRWHPSLERNLLAKANAAIEKAADTKEVRIGLGSLLGS